MVFDYSNLKGEIRKKYKSYRDLASESGICYSAIADHIRLGKPFTVEQIYKLMNALSLSITSEQLLDLFFTIKT